MRGATRPARKRGADRQERAADDRSAHVPHRFLRVDGEKLTDRDKLPTRRLEHWLLNSGDTSDWEERTRLRRPTLRECVSKLLFDTLSADACPIELIYTNSGKLSGWQNLDFSTIRLCSEHGYEGDDEVRAVQVIDYVPYSA